MKRNKFYILCIFLLVLLVTSSVLASTLTLNISSDKNKPKKDDEITIKVEWNKEMQAADFSLNYDSKKLSYIESNIDDVFINNSEEGKIKTAWVSMDNTDRTSVEYKFKVLKGGKLRFTTEIEGGFATGNLEIPEDYNNGTLVIGNSNLLLMVSIIIVIILILVIIIIILKNFLKRK